MAVTTRSSPGAPRAPMEDGGGPRMLTMQRSVSQLLFSYLPGKLVDWEEGLAIVELTNVVLKNAWSSQESRIVLAEIAAYLERWRAMGGRVHRNFPDPEREPGRFTVGEPESISATEMQVALHCMSCYRLVFATKNDLAKKLKNGEAPFACPTCGKNALRQFPQIFVHGCGNVVRLDKWMPTVRGNDDGTYAPTKIPLICPVCGDSKGIPAIRSLSERARDLAVVCQRCGSQIGGDRLSARCHDCLQDLPALPEQPADGTYHGREPTIITQILMRVTSYRASNAYYPHSITILRLDRTPDAAVPDAEVALLRTMMPNAAMGGPEEMTVGTVQALTRQLVEAQQRADPAEVQRLLAELGRVATGGPREETPQPQDAMLQNPPPDTERMLRESLALKTTVRTRSYEEVLRSDVGGATAALLPHIAACHTRLRLRPIRLVEDLPVITATFGFSRRAYEPVYEEGEALLPTQLHPFYSLDNYAAQRLNQLSVRGTVPILAREGDHEGIFLGLDPEAVVCWLAENNVILPDDGRPPIARILDACESMEGDRYYDHVYERPVRRMVFGLVHALSHAAMRVVSRYAGLERTSLSEYLFLPLLGAVIYANSSVFTMGAMETMLRSNLYAFLSELDREAMSCLLDTDCIDHRGACAGCLHAPEICCRMFNHGLSRAFLIGGHAPWVDPAVDERLIGYWQMP